ncbi:unnamed protein product, partial [Owenia fusiformis]
MDPSTAYNSVPGSSNLLLEALGTSNPLNATAPMFNEMQAMRALKEQQKPQVLLERQIGQTVEEGDDIEKIAQESVEAKLSDEVFSNYRHSAILEGAQPHPGDIVEAGMLADLDLPNPTYPLQDSLPPTLVSEGKLSSLQLEGILYACQRHQLILANQTRAGFFIGDGAGVGKGRQVAGIVLDNFARGRTKHIWFSISTDLIVDARRDLEDIGCYVKVIEGCQQLDKETRALGLPSDFKDGVIFSTYATLVSSTQKGGFFGSAKQSRLQQLVKWCGGENFEGCLIFDECHKAKNFVPGKEQSSTKVALAVASIQRILPKARVVYCSATGVTDVKNMAFMERLGLWGEGAPFKSFEQFLDSVHRKGLGIAEMLAMEMKSSGMYVSRGLSFRQAEFCTIEAELTKDQIKMYDTAAHVWNETRKALESAISRTATTNNRIWASYWGCHQRFFKQMCMGMKVPAIVKEAKEALNAGHSVVIGLQTTGEASMESELNKGVGAVQGFISLCREILSRFIEQHFPTVIAVVPNSMSAVNEVKEDDWSVTAKTMLLDFAKKIDLPNSPLDDITDQLGGPEAVAEMTGRRGRIVRHNPGDVPAYELRASDNLAGLESLNVKERNLFMSGKKLVAIISDAASTGISLHTDLRVANQCRRVHITLELPWSADKAVQQMGRSHRSNQSSGPLYKLLTTNLGGERRFASAVARRLQSLGAITKGDRRAATGADLTEFNFDTPYGRSALRAMYHAVIHKDHIQGVNIDELMGTAYDFDSFNEMLQQCLVLMGIIEMETIRFGGGMKKEDNGDVGKFLNRILGLSVTKQNLIFQYFSACLEHQIESAKREGRYNEGLLDISATSIEIIGEPKEVFKKANKGTNITQHVVLNVDRGMSWDSALTRLANHGAAGDGFYESRRAREGKRWYLLATRKENSHHSFTIARPNTGVSSFEENEADLTQKYTKISQEKAESHWNELYQQTESHCIHGHGCKTGPACTVGSRCYRLHLLVGGTVTMMSLLETTMARHQDKLQLSKAECNLRVVRVQLNDGKKIIGIRYPELLIPLVEKAIEEQKILEQMQKQQYRQTVLANGMVVQIPIPETSTSDQSPAAFRQTVVEPVADVKPRCLKNAITPPLTLKNFFKSTGKKSTSFNKISSESSSEGETQSNSSNAEVLNYTNKGEQSQSESPGKENDTCNTFDSSQVKRITDSPSLVTSNKKRQQPTHSQLGNPTKRPKVQNSILAAFAKQTSQPKPKVQNSIMAAFAKQANQSDEKAKKQLECPICQKPFELGTNNKVMN